MVLICFSLIISDVGPSLVAETVKRLPIMRETRVKSLGRQDPLEKEMAIPTPVFLPGKSHGWRILVGYCPWGHKESDTTERLHRSDVEHFFRMFVEYFYVFFVEMSV